MRTRPNTARPRWRGTPTKARCGFLEIVGGGVGMAGAVTLAARAALASGLGLARAHVAEASVAPLQEAVPQAMTRSWTASDVSSWASAVAAQHAPTRTPTALAIGPGLGKTLSAIAVMREVLEANSGVPVVLDADALNILSAEQGDVAQRVQNGADMIATWCVRHIH